jgi:hypothetical protein
MEEVRKPGLMKHKQEAKHYSEQKESSLRTKSKNNRTGGECGG